MLATVSSATLLGVDGLAVSVEVHVGNGLPGFTVVGLPDASCREARDRTRAAVLTSGLEWPQRRTTVNLAPTTVRKVGAGLDLAIAVAVLVATEQLPPEAVEGRGFLGELGLDGSLRHVPGMLSLVDAVEAGEVVVPPSSVAEAGVVARHVIRTAPTLARLVESLRAEAPWPPLPDPPTAPPQPPPPDLSEVRGHLLGRHAIELAAAGGHHLLMTGPPGAGKTLLAQRLPGILPDLDDATAFDATRIHSAAGLPLPGGLVRRPPLRAPHHGASAVAIIGGGAGHLRPGEISLAHATVTERYQDGGMVTRAAIYTRISADRTGTGLGVQRQETDCTALCEAREWEVALRCSDNDVSAYSGRRRPGYEQLLDSIAHSHVDAVVAWHPDRLHRSPRELERFIDLVEHHRVHVATVQGGQYDLSTAAGRMTARVVGAVARHESEHKSERHRAKAAELARAGAVAGGGTRPYGFHDDRVTIRVDEAAVIRNAARRVLAGETLRGICADLNHRGVATVTGATWSPTVLRRVLTSARTAGLREHHGTTTPAVWPAILTTAQHHRLVAVLCDPARRVNHTARRYPLTGLAHCALCDARLVARPRADRTRCYVCATGPGNRGCGKIRVLAEPLEDLVARQVFAVIDERTLSGRLDDRPGDDAVLLRIAAIEARLDELAAEWATGTIDRRSWGAARQHLVDELAALRATLANVDAAQAWAGRPGTLADAWPGLRVDQQQAILAAVVERVVVGPAVRGRSRFDPDRVSTRWR